MGMNTKGQKVKMIFSIQSATHLKIKGLLQCKMYNAKFLKPNLTG